MSIETRASPSASVQLGGARIRAWPSRSLFRSNAFAVSVVRLGGHAVSYPLTVRKAGLPIVAARDKSIRQRKLVEDKRGFPRREAGEMVVAAASGRKSSLTGAMPCVATRPEALLSPHGRRYTA